MASKIAALRTTFHQLEQPEMKEMRKKLAEMQLINENLHVEHNGVMNIIIEKLQLAEDVRMLKLQMNRADDHIKHAMKELSEHGELKKNTEYSLSSARRDLRLGLEAQVALSSDA